MVLKKPQNTTENANKHFKFNPEATAFIIGKDKLNPEATEFAFEMGPGPAVYNDADQTAHHQHLASYARHTHFQQRSPQHQGASPPRDNHSAGLYQRGFFPQTQYGPPPQTQYVAILPYGHYGVPPVNAQFGDVLGVSGIGQHQYCYPPGAAGPYASTNNAYMYPVNPTHSVAPSSAFSDYASSAQSWSMPGSPVRLLFALPDATHTFPVAPTESITISGRTYVQESDLRALHAFRAVLDDLCVTSSINFNAAEKERVLRKAMDRLTGKIRPPGWKSEYLDFGEIWNVMGRTYAGYIKIQLVKAKAKATRGQGESRNQAIGRVKRCRFHGFG